MNRFHTFQARQRIIGASEPPHRHLFSISIFGFVGSGALPEETSIICQRSALFCFAPRVYFSPQESFLVFFALRFWKLFRFFLSLSLSVDVCWFVSLVETGVESEKRSVYGYIVGVLVQCCQTNINI